MPTPEPSSAQGANGEGKPATQRKYTCKIRKEGLDAGHVCQKGVCETVKEGPVKPEHVRKATSAKYMSQEQLVELTAKLSPFNLEADAKQNEVQNLYRKSVAMQAYICPSHWHFSFNIPNAKVDPMCTEHRAEYRESYARKSAGQTKAKTTQEDHKATPASQSQAVAGASSSSRHDPQRSGRSQSPARKDRGRTNRSRPPMHHSGSSARDPTHHGASPAPASKSADHSKGPMPPSGPSDGDRRARDRTPVPPPGSSAGDPTHHGAPSASASASAQHSADAEKPRLKTPKENAMAIRAANHRRDPREGNRLEFEALELHEVKKDIDGMNADDGFEPWVRERDEQGWVHKGPRG